MVLSLSTIKVSPQRDGEYHERTSPKNQPDGHRLINNQPHGNRIFLRCRFENIHILIGALSLQLLGSLQVAHQIRRGNQENKQGKNSGKDTRKIQTPGKEPKHERKKPEQTEYHDGLSPQKHHSTGGNT